MLIDADKARLISDTVVAADRDAFDSALATLKLDSTRPQSWTYDGTQPAYPKRVFAGMVAYWEPEPAAGLIAYGVVNDSPDGAMWVVLQNTRSRRTIDAKMGDLVLSRDDVNPDDQDAFKRWTQTVELTTP